LFDPFYLYFNSTLKEIFAILFKVGQIVNQQFTNFDAGGIKPADQASAL